MKAMTVQEAQSKLEVALARFGQATYEAERWSARKAAVQAEVQAAEAAFAEAQVQAKNVPVAEPGNISESVKQ